MQIVYSCASHNNNVYKETRFPLQSMQWNFSQHTDTCCSSQQAASDKGAKANAYQIILNASSETEARRGGTESAEQEDYTPYRVWMLRYLYAKPQNKFRLRQNALCQLGSLANRWTRTGNSAARNSLQQAHTYKHTHTYTYTHTRASGNCFCFTSNCNLSNCGQLGRFPFFCSKYFRTSFGWQLAQLIPLPVFPPLLHWQCNRL